uniref:G-protein coupled receptors family 2 profile 1 domain-containing protein n=1 Tax=Xiphophorus couchianus TaxID=32473 RepID=A0A3B5KJB0_9TELE
KMITNGLIAAIQIKMFPVITEKGLFCAPMWDGFLCWNETPAGESVTLQCPDHPDLGPTGKVSAFLTRVDIQCCLTIPF